LKAGVKVCLLKRRLVFVRPQELPGYVILNGGKIPVIERQRLAPPFFAAAVAKEAERKLFRTGTVSRFPCKRQAHVKNL
jgi:hypothetical protein